MDKTTFDILFLRDERLASKDGIFTIYVDNTRIIGVDPTALHVEKSVTVSVDRKRLLEALDAGELHPPPEENYQQVNILDDEELASLKNGDNDREIDGVIANRKAKEDLTQAFKNALAAGCVIWPTSCICGGEYAWLTPGKHGGHTMFGCICHNEPPDYVDDYADNKRIFLNLEEPQPVSTVSLVNHTNPKEVKAAFENDEVMRIVEEYNKRNVKPPRRFTLGHLQALYEHIFKVGLPRGAAGEFVEHGYWAMSSAYWHGRQGGRFIECVAQPWTCGHAAYQAGYDTGVRGEYPAPVEPIAQALTDPNPLFDVLSFEEVPDDPGGFKEIERLRDLGHTDHCAKRIVWGDGECECGVTNEVWYCPEDCGKHYPTMEEAANCCAAPDFWQCPKCPHMIKHRMDTALKCPNCHSAKLSDFTPYHVKEMDWQCGECERPYKTFVEAQTCCAAPDFWQCAECPHMIKPEVYKALGNGGFCPNCSAPVYKFTPYHVKETDWQCGECERPWPTFKQAHACCSNKPAPPYLCTICGMNHVDAENGFDTCQKCLKNV